MSVLLYRLVALAGSGCWPPVSPPSPATTINAVADAADTPPPTLYRLFGSRRGRLAAVLDTAFGGDDEPIPFVDRPPVRAAIERGWDG